MPIYTVHQPRILSGDAEEDAERLVFVSEGLCWPALYLNFVWPLVKGQWLVALGALSATLAVEALIKALGLPLSGFGTMLVSFYLGIEGNNLWRWTLGRRGWRTVGITAGASRDDCETRFFDAWQKNRPVAPPDRPHARVAAGQASTATGNPVLGLFPERGT